MKSQNWKGNTKKIGCGKGSRIKIQPVRFLPAIEKQKYLEAQRMHKEVKIEMVEMEGKN